MEPMVEQEVKPITPEQPHAVAPEASTLVVPPGRPRGIWHPLSVMVIGALCAVGAMWVFTMSQGRHAASQSAVSEVSEIKPALPAVTSVDPSTVRVHEQQMQHITLASDVPWIKVGQPVEVHVLAYPDAVFKATISYIGAAVDPATHRVDVRAVVDNHTLQLKPEMFANFRIITKADMQRSALQLSAIVRDGEKARVWLAQPEHQFVRREVKLGLEQDGYVQILSSVQPGEQAVVEGGLLLGTLAGS